MNICPPAERSTLGALPDSGDIPFRRMARLQRLYRELLAESEVVLQSPSATEMLARTCQRLVHGTPFQSAWVGCPDTDGARFDTLAWANVGKPELRHGELRLDGGTHSTLAARAWRSGDVVFDNDYPADPRMAPWRDVLLANHWQAVLAAPVRRGGGIWAVLVLVSPEPDAFDPSTVDVARLVAALLGRSLDELDLKERLRQQQRHEALLARRDALTGLPNRLALEQYLPAALAGTRTRGTVAAVGMLDLDDFKPINDTFGHEAGDRLLSALAERLRSWLRAEDFVARQGGDEFVVVIGDLDELQVVQQLQQALERLHRAVQTPVEIAPGHVVEVGMSMGVALFPLDAADGDTLLRRADAALYQAKLHKHDRARWWRLGTSDADTVADGAAFDPYGREASALLAAAHDHFEAVSTEFVEAVQAEMQRSPQAGALACLGAAGLAELRRRQAEFLRFLFRADTSRDAIAESAGRLGQVHALVGVDSVSMVRTRAAYRAALGARLNAAPLLARQRHRLLLAAENRLQDSLQSELRAAEATQSAYWSILGRAMPPDGDAWTDWLRTELPAIGDLPGVTLCVLLQPDAEGRFHAEAGTGRDPGELNPVLREQDPRSPEQPGNADCHRLFTSAWRQGRIASVACCSAAADTASPARSLVAVPLCGPERRADGLLVIRGAHPGQFETPWMQQFLAALQRHWDLLRRRLRSDPA